MRRLLVVNLVFDTIFVPFRRVNYLNPVTFPKSHPKMASSDPDLKKWLGRDPTPTEAQLVDTFAKELDTSTWSFPETAKYIEKHEQELLESTKGLAPPAQMSLLPVTPEALDLPPFVAPKPTMFNVSVLHVSETARIMKDKDIEVIEAQRIKEDTVLEYDPETVKTTKELEDRIRQVMGFKTTDKVYFGMQEDDNAVVPPGTKVLVLRGSKPDKKD